MVFEYDSEYDTLSTFSFATLPMLSDDSPSSDASCTIPDSTRYSLTYLSACDPDFISSISDTQDGLTSSSYVFMDNTDELRYPYDTVGQVGRAAAFKEAVVTRKGVVQRKKYKPVARKVQPVVTSLPTDYQIECKIIGDPLETMPTLSPNPPEFTPTERYTQERRDALWKIHDGFLWEEELKLMDDFMCKHEEGFWEGFGVRKVGGERKKEGCDNVATVELDMRWRDRVRSHTVPFWKAQPQPWVGGLLWVLTRFRWVVGLFPRRLSNGGLFLLLLLWSAILCDIPASSPCIGNFAEASEA